MKLKTVVFIFFLSLVTISFAQNTSNTSYRAEKDKIHNLIHTKLKVDFNFQKKQLNGEAWITLRSHFYASNKLTLDAKAMLIHEISLENKILDYFFERQHEPFL